MYLTPAMLRSIEEIRWMIEDRQGLACIFGDVDPSAIAQANNISVGATLTSGQQLSIP